MIPRPMKPIVFLSISLPLSNVFQTALTRKADAVRKRSPRPQEPFPTGSVACCQGTPPTQVHLEAAWDYTLDERPVNAREPLRRR